VDWKTLFGSVALAVVLLGLAAWLIGEGSQHTIENAISFATAMLGFGAAVVSATRSVLGVTGMRSFSREEAVGAGVSGLVGAALIFVSTLL
jgi:hypothetical protein